MYFGDFSIELGETKIVEFWAINLLDDWIFLLKSQI